MASNDPVNSGRSLLFFYSVLKKAQGNIETQGNKENCPLPSRSFPFGQRTRVERDLSEELQRVPQSNVLDSHGHTPFQPSIHFVTFMHPTASLARLDSSNASLAASGVMSPLMFSAPGKDRLVVSNKPVSEPSKKRSLGADINESYQKKKMRLN